MNKKLIGEFSLDQDTGVISRGEYSVKLDPKVLGVLLVLLERPGKVVSQKELLDKLWRGRVVDPNALHRCIRELRKAFKDDARQQAIVGTYSKRGYSITASVCENPRAEPETLFYSRLSRPFVIAWAGFGAIILIVIFLSSMKLGQSGYQYKQLIPLTSTDQTEFYSVFSPDGRYIAFARQTVGPNNHLIAKDLRTNTEYQLTKKPGVLNDPDWSPDGSKLLFVQVNCSEPNCLVPERKCMSLSVMDFSPMSKPEPAKLITPCTPNSEIYSPRWLSNDRIAYIDSAQVPPAVITIGLSDFSEHRIYQDKEYLPYHLSYSSQNSKLAIAVEKSIVDSNPEVSNKLVLWNSRTFDMESLTIDSNIPTRWRPNWKNDGAGFLMSSDNKLYQLSLQGEVVELGFPSTNNIFLPSENPVSPGIAMTVGQYDYDILEVILQEEAPPIISIRNRTTKREEFGVYRPHSEDIAFFSNRNGSNQIWLSSSGQISQLSKFELDDRSSPLSWSPDGTSLAGIYGDQIHLFEFANPKDTNVNNIKAINGFISPKLHEWIDESSLLLSAGSGEERALLKYSIDDETIEILTQGDISSARISKEGDIYVQISALNGSYTIKFLSEHGLIDLNHLQDFELLPGFGLIDELLLAVTVQRELLFYFIQSEEITARVDLSHTKVRSFSDALPRKDALLLNNRPEMRSEIYYWHK